jgi:hypothetical protein
VSTLGYANQSHKVHIRGQDAANGRLVPKRSGKERAPINMVRVFDRGTTKSQLQQNAARRLDRHVTGIRPMVSLHFLSKSLFDALS